MNTNLIGSPGGDLDEYVWEPSTFDDYPCDESLCPPFACAHSGGWVVAPVAPAAPKVGPAAVLYPPVDVKAGSKPFYHRSIWIPRDAIPAIKNRTPGERLLTPIEFTVLVALYELNFVSDFEDDWSVDAKLSRLKELTGVSLRKLKLIIGIKAATDGSPAPLAAWVTDPTLQPLNPDRPTSSVWNLTLTPVNTKDFIRIPIWWLWEPSPDGSGLRIKRRIDGTASWSADDGALLACATIARMGANHQRSTAGQKRLAEWAGTSRGNFLRWVQKAEHRGLIIVGKVAADGTVTGRLGGGQGQTAVRTVQLVPVGQPPIPAKVPTAEGSTFDV